MTSWSMIADEEGESASSSCPRRPRRCCSTTPRYRTRRCRPRPGLSSSGCGPGASPAAAEEEEHLPQSRFRHCSGKTAARRQPTGPNPISTTTARSSGSASPAQWGGGFAGISFGRASRGGDERKNMDDGPVRGRACTRPGDLATASRLAS